MLMPITNLPWPQLYVTQGDDMQGLSTPRVRRPRRRKMMARGSAGQRISATKCHRTPAVTAAK